MFSYYKNVDENDIREIQNNEEKICNKFKEEFEGRYIDILRRYGIHSEISIERCIDDIGLPWKKNDGYAAILQVDFLDSNNSVIEIDENVFSFYEDITVVSYILFKRKYRVYQADKLEELWTEIENAIKLLNDFGIGKVKNPMNFVKGIINDWDPIDLLCCHAPDDEYHSEIEEIRRLLCVTDDPNELAEGIFKIFVESFGEETFKQSKAECKRIARLLLSEKY